MSNNSLSEQDKKSHSVLGTLSEGLPKVGYGGGGMGCSDISLSFAHRYAIQLAEETLEGVSKEEISVIDQDLNNVFCKWRDDHGVYPTYNQLLLGLGAGGTQQSAKEYCDQLIRDVGEKEAESKFPRPWECCHFVRSPLGLFWKLWTDDYQPLVEYLNTNNVRLTNVIAVLILISNKTDSEYQSGDCIEAALKLSLIKLDVQKHLIAEMTPAHQAEFNRNRARELKAKIKSEETARKVISAYQNLCKEKGEGEFIYKAVAQDAGVSDSTVTRILRDHGIERYNTK